MPLAASPMLCSLLVAVMVPPAEAPKPVQGTVLRYRFSEGESVLYRIDHESTIVATKGGQFREKNANRTRTDQRFEVVSVDADGTATLRVVIDRARMECAFNDQKPVVFDSKAKNLPAPAFAPVSQAIGQPLAEIQVRRDGTVESARPLFTGGGAAAGGAGGDGHQSLFAPMPDGPANVGDEWNDTFVTKVEVSRGLSREVTILRQFRLESVENGVATIAFKTAPLTAVTEPGQLLQLIQRTSAGKIRFDVAAGRIVGRTVHVDNVETGWAGGDSSYRAVCRWEERLLTEETKVSAR